MSESPTWNKSITPYLECWLISWLWATNAHCWNFSKKYMYEAIHCAVCQSVCLMKCNMSRASLNIENIGHVSIVPPFTIIATYREEKLVGRPRPNRMMKTGKVVRDSESVIITLWEELGKEVSPLTMKEVGNKNGIFWNITTNTYDILLRIGCVWQNGERVNYSKSGWEKNKCYQVPCGVKMWWEY